MNDNKEADPIYITYRDVADMLGVRLGTVYSMVARRQIPFVRVGRRLVRFSKARISSWLEARSVEPRTRGTSDAPTEERGTR
jgi:excisionase family DNA binding protein